MKRLRLLSFALYDAGETILGALLFSTLYPLYITQHIDVKTYSLFYGFTFLISFFVALHISRVADQRAIRKPFFILFSLSIVALCLLLFLTFEKAKLNFFLYLLLALFHQQALIFYNSLLRSFEKRGSASGFGVAFGYVGSAFALILLAPRLSLPHAFLWLALTFFLFCLPSIFLLPEPSERQRVNLKEVLKDKSFLLVLLSMLLLMELAHTMIAMMGVYLRDVYGFGREEVYRVIGFSAFGGIFGGVLWGRLADKLSAERLFPLGFFLWSILLISLYFAPKALVLLVGLLAGFSLAHLWTTSRVFLIEKFAKGDVAVRFSFYSLSERIASSLGLFAWSFFLYATGNNYKLSALLMLVFPLLGFFLHSLSNRRL
ncbi:MAG: MFS transporter [Aquificaceae bacterium]